MLLPLLSWSSPRGSTLLSALVAGSLLVAVAAQGPMDSQLVDGAVEGLVARELEGWLFERQATNLQTFTGALGGIVASPITNTGDAQRRFGVDGNTFTDFASAASRSCSNQHNSCANLANSNRNAGFTVGQCDSQQAACNSAAATATQTTFQVKFSSDANFDIFCDA